MFETALLTKVAILLTGSMALGGLGAFCGRNIRSLGAFLLLALVFIGGTIAIAFAAHVSPVLAVFLMAGWTFVSGLIMGPAIEMYSERLGWETVAGAYVGTGAVMCGCGAFGMLSGIDFSFLGGILFVGLLGLVVVGLVTIFWRLSRTGRIVESLFGMLIFSGYFIFDFFRLAKSENTWEAAINLTVSLYLDFLNFFMYLLQILDALQNHN